MAQQGAHSRAVLKTVITACAMLLLWGVSWQAGGLLPAGMITFGLFVSLITLTWFDFDHYRIPNWISYPLIVAGLALAYGKGFNNLAWHGFGAALGYGLIWGLNAYWKKRNGQDGIGMGDAKLLAAAGAWLGPLLLPFVTLIASGCGLIIICFTHLLGGGALTKKTRIAFGPFIAFGLWSMWLLPPV